MKTKWLYLLPVILCLALSLIFADIFERQKKISFEQAFQDKKDAVEIVDAIVNGYLQITDNDSISSRIFFENSIIGLAEYMDSTDNIYAALYDSRLQRMSRKLGAEMQQYPHWSPVRDSVFLNSVNSHSPFGKFEMQAWDAKNTLSIWFRWIQVNENTRYLFVVGITEGIVYEFENSVFFLVCFAIIFTVILNFIQIYSINRHHHANVEK